MTAISQKKTRKQPAVQIEAVPRGDRRYIVLCQPFFYDNRLWTIHEVDLKSVNMPYDHIAQQRGVVSCQIAFPCDAAIVRLQYDEAVLLTEDQVRSYLLMSMEEGDWADAYYLNGVRHRNVHTLIREQYKNGH